MIKTCSLPVVIFFLSALLIASCNSGGNPANTNPTTTTCIPDADSGSQDITIKAQETDEWCWAASGQMCMQFLGTSVQQCDEANKEFSANDCCNNPAPGACVNGGWPQFDKYGFSASQTNDSALSFGEIQHQIYCLKSPVAFSWHYTGGGGHMMVITGYTVVDSVQYLTIIDPLPTNVGEERTITYSEYVDGSDHTHWNDYYNIKRM